MAKVKTQFYTYDDETGELVAPTGHGVFVAMNDLFNFKINLAKSYAAKYYKITFEDETEFSGDFEDLLNLLAKTCDIRRAKSNRNAVPKHVIYLTLNKPEEQEVVSVEKPKTKKVKGE